MTEYRIASEEDRKALYDVFDIHCKLEQPCVVAVRNGQYVGYLGSSYTEDNILICGPGAVNLPVTAMVWMKLHHFYDRAAVLTGRRGYLIWAYEEDDEWCDTLARLPRFSIIGRDRGKMWYKRIYPEAKNGRK